MGGFDNNNQCVGIRYAIPTYLAAGSLQSAYPPKSSGSMTDHIHVDIKYKGRIVNPESLIP